jgi:hypothetical protein
MNHDDHGGGMALRPHHQHCRTVWQHHHKVRRCS